jgi:hypothetical protein
MKWQGAAIFAVIPLFALVFFQASVFYSEPFEWVWKTFEPTLYILPVLLVAAASGVTGAERCMEASWSGVLALGAAFGAGWSLAAVLAGAAVLSLIAPETRLSPRNLITAYFVVLVFLAPLAIIVCGWTRFYLRKRARQVEH